MQDSPLRSLRNGCAAISIIRRWHLIVETTLKWLKFHAHCRHLFIVMQTMNEWFPLTRTQWFICAMHNNPFLSGNGDKLVGWILTVCNGVISWRATMETVVVACMFRMRSSFHVCGPSKFVNDANSNLCRVKFRPFFEFLINYPGVCEFERALSKFPPSLTS